MDEAVTHSNESSMDEKSQNQENIRAYQAHHIVIKYTSGAMTIAMVPIPAVDLAMVMGTQVKMVHSICNHYQQPFSHDAVKSVITSLVGSLAAVTTTGTITSAVKVIPIIGTAVGFVGGATLFGATTYAVGQIFVEHFESGGTFLDFNPEEMQEHFQQLFKEGQQYVIDAKKKLS